MKVAADLFLNQRPKIQVMKKLSRFLIIFCFPIYDNTNSESTPTKPLNLYIVLLLEILSDLIWMEGWMKFYFDFLCKILEAFLSFSCLNKEFPSVFVLFLSILLDG
jgi:hypothetical protein